MQNDNNPIIAMKVNEVELHVSAWMVLKNNDEQKNSKSEEFFLYKI